MLDECIRYYNEDCKLLQCLDQRVFPELNLEMCLANKKGESIEDISFFLNIIIQKVYLEI